MSRHSTPLRYPGGKQKIAPFVIELLEKNDLIGCDYVEAYAGGAGVAIELILSDRIRTAFLNDVAEEIYAFWHSILSFPDRFIDLILKADISIEEWRRQREILRNKNQEDPLALGFATFYLNRCNRSGILQGGVIGGLSQMGSWKMGARFPRNELIRRVEAIATRRDRIFVSRLDAVDFITRQGGIGSERTFFYFDPPYFRKADRLYRNSYGVEDHLAVSRAIQGIRGAPWIVSYDYSEQIRSYYGDRRMFSYSLRYNAATSYLGTELLIFSDGLLLPNNSSISAIADALSRRA